MSANIKFRLEIGRLVRFGIVGVLASATYSAAAYFIVKAGIGTPIAATIIGQLLSAFVSYFGHQRFSFAVASTHEIFAWRFVTIFVFTIVLNVGVTYVLTVLLNVSHAASIAVVTVLLPITNYFCNRFWVFRLGLESP